MRVRFSEPIPPQTGTVAVGVEAGRKLTPAAADIDKRSGGALKRAMAASRFKGGDEQVLDLLAPARPAFDRVVLLGLGKAKDFDELKAQALGGRLVAHLNGAGASAATVIVDGPKGAALAPAAIAANLAFGARLRSYRFDKYRTKEDKDKKPSLRTLTVAVKGAAAARRAHQPLDKVADGIFFTRDLVSEPANVIYPASLARQAKTLEKLGVRVEVLDERAMKRLGMGALLGVGQGSANPPRLVVMRWRGAGAARPRPKAKGRAAGPIAFVGKGVTFDTGGISIKPSAGMEDMKWDMGGSGVVIGLMKALAGRKAKVDAVGVIGLVANMPSATAQRPGDIVKSMSGQTIEVLNTDAEGRLVLADALWYCQKRFKPRFMVDLATLTGAIIVALGNEYAGLFSNNDRLAERLAKAGEAVGEKLWRMPLGKAYDRQIDSPAADVKNIGEGRGAGSITAAQFLQRFVAGAPWAHIDIAAVTWSKKDKATVPKGGTAFGVRLLERFVREHYEGK